MDEIWNRDLDRNQIWYTGWEGICWVVGDEELKLKRKLALNGTGMVAGLELVHEY